ncbi:tetratricopeptide repeat protein [Rhodobacter sp. NTK016B]|uniref:tetratricopeptide repeat protein n=1 Tax=Rhodobacter sp. NTK016B TaxID=2759676 RepID=UPI001A8CD541|nr:tetratricopeptide repeat protein [Rhodobacter sp. NTK016B]MBN8293829.1 tetratricopeptide repeat protein [Rhodobacter sp. NTK016B]
MKTLAQDLWTAPLPDPDAPGRDLSERLNGLSYDDALAEAVTLVRMALPLDLRALQARWPGSIDLARLSVEAENDAEPLARAVERANRRRAALGWAYWSLDDPDRALAALARLDPASPSVSGDMAARAEIHILLDLPADIPPGPQAARLSLLQSWRREGASALARRVGLEAPALPAAPGLWSWLIDTFVAERDFDSAGAAYAQLAARHPDHPATRSQRIRLALEQGRTAEARHLLDAQGETDAPWRWSAQRHVQHMRCLLDTLSAGPQPDYAPVLDHATRALRLFARNRVLQGLHLQARELADDWGQLSKDLATHPDPRMAARSLLRLGLPEAALARLPLADPALPDDALRTRLRRAEALLRAGRPDAAAQALGPAPVAAPMAAEHGYWLAEIAAATRDLTLARDTLSRALDTSPTRMGLRLSAARVAFLSGDAEGAKAQLDAFRSLKTAELGADPGDDLRDRIVADALSATPGPAQAALGFARAIPGFTPLSHSPIPPRVAHYWEGPRSSAVERSLAAWGALYPQRLFDAKSARDWLATNTALAPLFDRLPDPATRADLFRLALLTTEGGIFVDLDEYPRADIADWLDHARLVMVIEEGHATIANNFLAAEPGLPFFATLRDRVAASLHATDTPYPWWHSGPAQITQDAAKIAGAPGIRFLTQPDYETRIATNLPFPHKRSAAHWR